MSDLLVVGNGFDLYHGLPTRYTDFLSFIRNWSVFWESYKNELTSGSDDQLKIRLSEYNEIIPDSMIDFASYHGQYKYDHLEFINSHIDNSWIQYFMKKHMAGPNWIDFEGEIYDVLRLVEEYYTEFIPEMRFKNDAPIKQMKQETQLVLNSFKSRCSTRYVDFTRVVISRKNTEPDKLKKNKEAFLGAMKSELNDLIRCLDYYLLDFVSKIRIEKYSEQIAGLSRINLLNFNYTNTYSSVYGITRFNEHHRIHGDCSKENMVLGIPDEAFPKMLDYIYFQKYFQRIQKRTGNYYKTWITAPDPRMRTLEDVPINAFFMGHSLAESDRGILREIFLNDYVNTITIYYHSQSAYEQQVINLVTMFGKDYVIDQTSKERIVFEKLKGPVEGIVR